MNARHLGLPLIALAAILVSCRKDEITTYRIPKEAAPAQPAAATPAAAPAATSGAGMAGTPVATATGAALAWTAPASWTAKPASGMRKGSYTITGPGGAAELAITAFPGDVGGDLANVNRWRGQLQLPPIAQAEFETATRHLDRNGLHITVVDLVGTGGSAQRILGAMVPHAGATWFFKLMGPDALVAQERTAFLAFVDTIKPAAP
jgi:hypothetical protein